MTDLKRHRVLPLCSAPMILRARLESNSGDGIRMKEKTLISRSPPRKDRANLRYSQISMC